jgi:hypothetical protein
VCSRVAAAERLSHEMIASIDQNILCQIPVSLKREENLACMPLASSTLSHSLLYFVSATLVPGQRGRAYVVGEGDQGVGSSSRCGGRPCHGCTCSRDFCLGGCCVAGQYRPPCQGCRRSGHLGRQGGTGEGIKSGGGEHDDISLCV